MPEWWRKVLPRRTMGWEPAFELLAHISSHTHRKVREVATELVASAIGRHGVPPDIHAILHDACPPPQR